MKKLYDKLNERFSLRQEKHVNVFIGCEFKWMENEKGVILHQNKIIDRLDTYFFKELMNTKNTSTPAKPGLVTQRPEDGDPLMHESMKKKYRSGVGTLLYLVKHSRPDLCNVTRNLSKNMDGGTVADFKNLMRAIKYTLDTRNTGLKMIPDKSLKWKLRCFSDSDWGSDPDGRKSISGWAIFFMNSLVAWGSRGQKNVSLSSTEAEYVAVSEVAKEVLHIKYIFDFLQIKLNLPIIIHVDNVGAIFLTKNDGGRRTRHIDMRYHFIREHIVEGILTIIFVRSEGNHADVFTKNTNVETYHRHHDQYMSEMPKEYQNTAGCRE